MLTYCLQLYKIKISMYIKNFYSLCKSRLNKKMGHGTDNAFERKRF